MYDEKMPETSTPITRNTERTRRALLDATIEAITERGAAITIAQVAEVAGVSKSGLLYHFHNREELIIAVVEDVTRRIRTEVAANLDLSENRPGKMLRAYVRTLCSPSDFSKFFASASAWSGLHEVSQVADVMAEDEQWWEEQFAGDGLDDDVILVVRRAAEGVASAAAFGEESPRAVAHARALLLRLTESGLPKA